MDVLRIHLTQYLNDLERTLEMQQSKIDRFWRMIEQMPAGIFWKDLDGVYEGFNRQCASLCYNGSIVYKDDGNPDIVGIHTEELFLSKTSQHVIDIDHKTLIHEQSTITAYQVALQSQVSQSLVTVRHPLRDVSNNVVGLLGVTYSSMLANFFNPEAT